jgi:hypothetical protein
MLSRSEASPREASVRERGTCVPKSGFAGGFFPSVRMTDYW